MKGTTLLEALIGLVLLLVVGAGLARVAEDAGAVFRRQPEAEDLVQRARVALETMTSEAALAGGGPFLLSGAGPLVRSVPPVIPRRVGSLRPDAADAAFADRFAVMTIPDGAAQAEVRGMASNSDPIDLQPGPWCPSADPLCGFRPDQQAIVFDATGAFDVFVVVAASPLAVTPGTPLTKRYTAGEGARVAGIRITTYAFDRTRLQLRRYDGDRFGRSPHRPRRRALGRIFRRSASAAVTRAAAGSGELRDRSRRASKASRGSGLVRHAHRASGRAVVRWPMVRRSSRPFRCRPVPDTPASPHASSSSGVACGSRPGDRLVHEPRARTAAGRVRARSRAPRPCLATQPSGVLGRADPRFSSRWPLRQACRRSCWRLR